MARTKILIDCDPGHDDAVAILYAARHLDLVGVTTCRLTAEGRRARHGAEPNALVALQSDARRLIDAVVDTMLTYA